MAGWYKLQTRPVNGSSNNAGLRETRAGAAKMLALHR